MKKTAYIIIAVLVAAALTYGFVKHPDYAVDPYAIVDINGGLGTGNDMGYDWYNGLPEKMQVGDRLQYAYNDGFRQFAAGCTVGMNDSNKEHPFYFCQVTWPENIAFQPGGGYERKNYAIKGTSKDNYLVSLLKSIF
jgi:hypothetical protein